MELSAPATDTTESFNLQKEAIEKIFRDVAGDNMEIGWMELKRILDHMMLDGNE